MTERAEAGFLRRRRLSAPALLRDNAAFRTYWSAHTLSQFGDQISFVALPLVGVLVLDATAAQMGYLTAAGLLPSLLALHAGAWVDRVGRRRRVMIASDVGRALLLGSVPLAYAFDVLTLVQLYVVALASGLLTVLFAVATSSLFVSIVPRERFVEANSLLEGSRAFSFVGGPPLAGALVQALAAPVALVVDAISFAGSAVCLGRISPREAPAAREQRGYVLAGARFMLASPILRASLLAAATINFFNFMFWALFFLYASRTLGVSPGTLGLVLGAAAFGGIVGSVIAGGVARRVGIGPAFALGCVVFAAPLVLVPLAGGPTGVILFCLFTAEFVSGIGVMVLDISAGSIKAALTPHRLRSRVQGAFMVVNYGVRVVGSLAGGALGTLIGLRPTLWIAAVGGTLGVLWLLPSPVLRLHELPEAVES